jgi:hypothetical protein
MISPILFVSAELVATLMVGQTGLPVGVPNPVVKRISVAPLAALPVVASTSLPGVQTRLRPGFRRALYNQAHPLPVIAAFFCGAITFDRIGDQAIFDITG